MFASFIEIQLLGGLGKQELLHFTKLMPEKRSKTRRTIITPFVPTNITIACLPNTTGIDKSSNLL
jgi:hypothetical protein